MEQKRVTVQTFGYLNILIDGEPVVFEHEKAKELLRTTTLRSSQIAPQIGYKDAHYFSFVFRKTQGMTPREYRQSSSPVV